MPVSVVDTFLGCMTFACLNHLSDWDNLMVFPSADLSPNLANASNCSFKAALSTGGLGHKGALSTDFVLCLLSKVLVFLYLVQLTQFYESQISISLIQSVASVFFSFLFSITSYIGISGCILILI